MIEIAGATNELVPARTTVDEAPSAEGTPLQRGCVAVLRAKWSTLAVVATEPSAPAKAVASALVESARACRLAPVRVLHGAGVPATQIPSLLEELAAARASESRAVITVDDPRTNPASGPLLVAADAVVLLVRLGSSAVRSVEEALELAGRERVLGCILVR